MDKTITTALMIVISMVMALLLFNIAYPAIIEGGEAIDSMAFRTHERMSSDLTIIHAAGELDKDGWWQDTNGNGDFDVLVWVKNTGNKRITALDQLDIFFGQEANFIRIPHQSNAGGSYPYWTWTVESGTEWTPNATLKITIHYGVPLVSGRYFFKIAAPVGVEDDYYLGM